MPRIRCRYPDCIFLDEGYCTAAIVEVDPNQGCLTYKPDEDDIPINDDLWDEDLDLDVSEGDDEDDDSVSWEAEVDEELNENWDGE